MMCMSCGTPVDGNASLAPGICKKCFDRDIKPTLAMKVTLTNGMVKWRCPDCGQLYDTLDNALQQGSYSHRCHRQLRTSLGG